MFGVLLKWLFVTLVVMAIPYVVSGVEVDGFGSALAAGAVLGVFNLFLKPLLIVLTLPLTLFSFGFFLIVINGFLFHLTAMFVSGLTSQSFTASFFASLCISIATWLSNLSLSKDSGRTRVEIRSSRPVSQGQYGERPFRDVTPKE